MLDLVGQHALHSLSEAVLRDPEVIGTMGCVDVYMLVQKGQGLVSALNSVEVARNVNDFTMHDHHFPAQRYLTGHPGFQVALEVVSTTDHHNLSFC